MSETLQFGFETGTLYSRLTITGPSEVITDALSDNQVLAADGTTGGKSVVVPQIIPGEDRTRLAIDVEPVDWRDLRTKHAVLGGVHRLIKHLSDLSREGSVMPDPRISFGAYQKETDDSYLLSAAITAPDRKPNQVAKLSVDRMAEMSEALRAHRGKTAPIGYRDRLDASVDFDRGMELTMLSVNGKPRVQTVGVQETEDQPRRWLVRSAELSQAEHLLIFTAGLVAVACAEDLLPAKS